MTRRAPPAGVITARVGPKSVQKTARTGANLGDHTQNVESACRSSRVKHVTGSAETCSFANPQIVGSRDADAGFVIAAAHVGDITERRYLYMSSLTRVSPPRAEPARRADDSHLSHIQHNQTKTVELLHDFEQSFVESRRSGRRVESRSLTVPQMEPDTTRHRTAARDGLPRNVIDRAGNVSWKALDWVTDSEVGSSTTKFILLLLANKADENFSCQPSIRT